LLALEFNWGRSNIRLQDYEKEYGCYPRVIRKALKAKLSMAKSTRNLWPMYAYYDEDAEFRDKKWNDHFDPNTGPRVLMHDATNISLPTPSDAGQQRALYNSYYSECCAKAGVGVQLCSWMRGLPLVTGHSDDDRLIKDSEVLQEQREFAESDPSSIEVFLNIFDKGYRCTLEAEQEGQECLQPDFVDSDGQFKGRQSLRSACVAVTRSGNERGVNRAKLSWLVKRGMVDQLWDVDMFCDAWEAWTFQVNFMYDKFL